jgi:hypothetical protein
MDKFPELKRLKEGETLLDNKTGHRTHKAVYDMMKKYLKDP